MVNSTISLLPFPLFLTSWKHRMTWVLRIWPDRGNVPIMKQGDGVTIINSWDKTWLLLGKSIQIMDDLIKTKHDTSRILEPWSIHTFTPLHLWLSKQMEFGYDYKTTSNSHFLLKRTLQWASIRVCLKIVYPMPSCGWSSSSPLFGYAAISSFW